jgi:hypothetical protein
VAGCYIRPWVLFAHVRVRNRDGRPVDPVPFLVAAGTAALGSYSFVPPYCLSLGLPLTAGLALATLVFLVAGGLAYHRLVRTARADRADVPPALRLRSLFYVALVVGALLVLASLPFYVD